MRDLRGAGPGLPLFQATVANFNPSTWPPRTGPRAVFQPDGATIDYGAAKAALVNLTKTLSQEFGPHGLRVNAVSPGPVATDLWPGEQGVAAMVAKATGVDPETARQTIIAGIGGFATGRFTTPDEVAALIGRRPDQDNLKTRKAVYRTDPG